jgi:hypothetical protein
MKLWQRKPKQPRRKSAFLPLFLSRWQIERNEARRRTRVWCRNHKQRIMYRNLLELNRQEQP